MCCALLSSAIDSNSPYTNWIPQQLSIAANNAFRALSKAIYGDSDELLSSEKKLVIELMPEVLPLINNTIKESSTSGSDDGDEITAASARVPLGYAIVAAYQFRWFVSQVLSLSLSLLFFYLIFEFSFGSIENSCYNVILIFFQVDYPHLGKVCGLVIPCGLTTLDHWSSEVKVCFLLVCLFLLATFLQKVQDV